MRRPDRSPPPLAIASLHRQNGLLRGVYGSRARAASGLRPPAGAAREVIGLLLTTVVLAACGGRSNLLDGSAGSAQGGAGGSASTGATSAGGSTGASGSTGVAGSAGGGPEPDVQSIIEACVIADACAAPSLDWPLFTASSCVDDFARLGWWYESPARLPDPFVAKQLLSCAASTKGDCGAFRGCFGGDWIALNRCREGASCAGNTMLSAPDGPTFECGAIGGTCMELWSNGLRACCNAEPCGGTGEFTCEGGKASFCGGWGERVDFDCAANGQTCTFDSQAPCKGVDACDPMSTTSICKGSVAVYCAGGGLTSHDCSTTGFRTACSPGTSPWENPCRPEFMECDPTAFTGMCDGESLIVCADGGLTSIDCSALGFGGCQQTMNGAKCTVGL